MLWEVADKVKRQHQYVQRGYSTRQDKRGDRHNGRGSLTERIVDSSYRNDKPNQKYCRKKRQRTDIDNTRFSPSVAPSVEFLSMNTAGSSHLHVETEDMGVYEDEEGMYDEEGKEKSSPTRRWWGRNKLRKERSTRRINQSKIRGRPSTACKPRCTPNGEGSHCLGGGSVRISSLLSRYPVPITNVDYTIIVLDSLQSVITHF